MDLGVKYDSRDSRVSQQDNYDNDTDGEDNIFSHLINTQKEGGRNNPLRFLISAVDVQQQRKAAVLIDTGSTLSTITAKHAQELQLKEMLCPPCVITYGNDTTQTSTRKAIIHLKFDTDLICTAYTYIVQQQNEEIILCMDWIIDEDITIHPKSKNIIKYQHSHSQKLDDIPNIE